MSSCGNQTELENRIEQLRNQNDSLTTELKKYEDKFVFEKVLVKHFPINNSRIKKGEKYYGEIVFVPYVEQDLILFGTERDTINPGIGIKNPITLKPDKNDFGGYKFDLDIVNDTTTLYFQPIVKNELALKHKNDQYNGAMISDKIITK